MVEKIGHIKNPLTVIAIFAAIAEISGTSVLPFISNENQSLYIWFLMIFPMFLVSAFFITLNINHRALYAPSDYKDERNFVNPYGNATPDEQGEKLREEVEELEAETSDSQSQSANTSQNDRAKKFGNYVSANEIYRLKHRQMMADITLAEKLAINKLSKELGIDFKTNARLEIPSMRVAAIYDGLGVGKGEVHAVEVKLFRNNHAPSRLAKILEQSEIISENFKGFDPQEFTLHIFAVIDADEVDPNSVRDSITELAKRHKVRIKVHVTTLNDLQNEYQYNT